MTSIHMRLDGFANREAVRSSSMITSIGVTGLRGVRTAKIDRLTPISVLVGKNGCGKSTMLDALAVAASASPAPQLTAAVERRTTDDSGLGADWILTKGLTQGAITIYGEGSTRGLKLTREGEIGRAHV